MEESYLSEIKALRQLIKDKEGQLHKKENFLESLLTSMDDLVFVLDTEGKFIDAFYDDNNKHALYAPQDEFMGKHHDEVLPGHMHAPFHAAFDRLVETRKPQQYEYQIQLGSGCEWYEARLSPLKNTATDFAGVVVVARNITGRKAAADILEKEKARLELVTESLGAGLVVVSKEYKVMWTNGVMKRRYPNYVGKECSHLHAGNPSECCPTKKVFDQGACRAIAECKNDPLWEKVISTPIKDAAGDIIAALELITFKSEKPDDSERALIP